MEQETPEQVAGTPEAGGTTDWNGVVPAALRQVWRVIVLVVGVTVVAVGVAMIVLPGPAFVVIPAGLGILATEFLWARRLLDRVKRKIDFQRFRDYARRD